MKLRLKRHGFTLLEVLIVLALVGILAAIAFPSYASYMVKARRAEAQLALMTVMQQQENFYNYHNTYQPFSSASTEPESQRFRWWVGDSPALSAYELSGQACPDTPLQRCIELRATPGTSRVDSSFRDQDCGTLFLNSIGKQGASGPMERCWP